MTSRIDILSDFVQRSVPFLTLADLPIGIGIQSFEPCSDEKCLNT